MLCKSRTGADPPAGEQVHNKSRFKQIPTANTIYCTADLLTVHHIIQIIQIKQIIQSRDISAPGRSGSRSGFSARGPSCTCTAGQIAEGRVRVWFSIFFGREEFTTWPRFDGWQVHTKILRRSININSGMKYFHSEKFPRRSGYGQCVLTSWTQ